MNQLGVNRKLWVFAVIIPLAIYLGWMLTDPFSFNAMAVVGLLLTVLITPILLRWHQPILLATWNASLIIFVLPGKPPLWMLIMGASLLILVLEAIIEKRIRFQNVKSITWTLLIFFAIVLITAKARGGIGLRTMGSEAYGGKKYIFIIAGVLGYFALSLRPIPIEKAKRWAALFFLGTWTFAVSDLIYLAGPAFYWLFLVFPVDFALSQATSEIDPSGLKRFAGIAFSSIGAFYYMMARYGIRGILNVNHPFRFLIWLGIILIALLGGFRSLVLLFGLIFMLQMWLERLLFTRFFFALLLMGTLCAAAMLPFVNRLPSSIQRTISFLPVDVDPLIRMDALASTEWRLLMWKQMLPDLKQYLWLGRGYVIDPTEMYMMPENQRRGYVQNYDAAIITGDYHSGPLSVLFNFGVAGTLAFIAFGVAGVRLLHRNMKYGEASLSGINTLLFSCFVAKFTLFWFIFGDISSDLPAFAGLLGFSAALNGGLREKVRSPASAPRPQSAFLAPGGLAPVGSAPVTARPVT